MREVKPHRNEPKYFNRPGQPVFIERRKRARSRLRRLLISLGITGLICLGLGRIWGIATVRSLIKSMTGTENRTDIETPAEVVTVQPRKGGLPRKIVQTGTLEAIETAEIQARVSGYIREIAFEIGEWVDAGQLVVEIDADELKKDVEKQAALVELAASRVKQARARLKMIDADREAARGSLLKTQAEVLRSRAEVALREKELERIRQLVAQKAIEKKLADEKIYQLEAARAGVENAQAAEFVAAAELLAIDSQTERAEADITAAEADVRVARADHQRATVMASYLKITSPFAGVITARNFDRGDFVHAASGNGQLPLLTIAPDVDDVIAAFHGDQQSASLDRQRGLDSLQEFENSNQRELLLLPGGFTEGEQTHQVPGTQWNAAATARDQSRSGSSRLRSRTWLQLLLRPVDRLKAIFHRGNEKR